MSEVSSTAIMTTPSESTSTLSALAATTKQGISRLVTITAAVGFIISAARSPVDQLPWVAALGAILGTWLAASGANSLNQWLEAARDLRMNRTKDRPIPSGQVPTKLVAMFGTTIAVIGVLIILLTAGPAPSLVALACVVSYLFAYTPLKTRTIHNTIIGAVPGALPALIGTAAAMPATFEDRLTDPLGWMLVLLLTLWQIPHFLAIAWMYRSDYRAGGFRMLPIVDRSGRLTAISMIVFTLGFGVVAATLPLVASPLGFESVLLAVIATIIWLLSTVQFARTPNDSTARQVFIVSIIVLPLMLLSMSAAAIARALFA